MFGRIQIVGCLALGALLRLLRPDLVAFKLDEAKFLNIVDGAASGRWPITAGMSSWGGFHPPLRAYLLAPARWVTGDAAAVPALLGVFSFLNLGGIALAGMTFGPVVSVAAVALSAASPWLLHFNRALWDAPLPVFGTFALYAALRTVASAGSRWAVAVVPLLALQALTHLTAWIALPVALYLAVRFQAFRARCFIGGAILGAFLLLPYVIVLMTGPEPLGQILSSRAESEGRSIGMALTFASWYVSGADLQALLGARYAPQYRFAPLLALGPFLVGFLLVVGAWAAVVSRRNGAGPIGDAAEVLLAWVLIPLGVTVALPGASQLHYFQTWGGGAPFILGGLGFSWIYERVRLPLGRALALAALLLIPVVQASAWIDLLGYVDRFPDTALGPPLGAWQSLATAARNGGHDNVIVWTEGDQPAYQDKPAALNGLLESEPTFMKRDSTVLQAGAPTIVIITPPRQDPSWGFNDLPGASVIQASNAGKVWNTGPATLAPKPPLVQRAPFVDGLTLEGYDWRVVPGSRQLQLVTFWVVEEPSQRARMADLTLFVHVEDGSGQRVGQDDGLDWPSARWTSGTRIAQRSSVDIAGVSRAVSIRIGIYSRKDQQRSPRLDDGGDSVVLGPLDLPPA